MGFRRCGTDKPSAFINVHGHTVETAVEARAGFLDRPVLAVLIASVVLIVVAFALTYASVVNI